MQRFLGLVLILLTLVFASEGWILSAQEFSHAEAHVLSHDSHASNDTHLHTNDQSSESHQDCSDSQHPCHIGHCSFVVLSESLTNERLPAASKYQYRLGNNFYASPGMNGPLRPPSRSEA